MANREAAVDFLQMVVAGKIEEGYAKHVDMKGKHHNPFYPSGFPALKQGMLENHAQFPNKKIQIKNIMVDGDKVAVHSHVILKAGETEFAAVHILRFEKGKIVEMWDVAQPSPATSPNTNGQF